jgi:sugar lactone lactonase YvrE
VVKVPVLCPTSIAFGGPDLRTMYVTTGRWKVGDPAENDALAGAVLVIDSPVAGCPVAAFGVTEPATP